MPTEAARNKAIVLQMYEEVWNKGNLDFINKVVSPDFEDHPSGRFFQAPVHGREAIYEVAKHFRAAMPDLHSQMIQVNAEDNLVYYLGRLTGTHTGQFFQVPPSGNKVNITGISGFRLESGLIVGQWGIFDAVGLMQQMGFAPGGPSAH